MTNLTSKEIVQGPNEGYTAFELRKAHAEIERLTTALATANANHEHFERLYYLELQKHESSDETTDDHEADLANQLQEVDRAFRGCLKELDGLRARMPTSDYILLSDTGEVHHKDYGMVLFATHDAVHSIEGIARSQEEPKATNGVWTSTWDQMPPKHVPVIMVRQGSEQIPRWHWRPLTAEASPVETKGIPETPEQWRARIEANALEDAHRMYEREHGEPFPGSGSK